MADSVAPENSLEDPKISRKVILIKRSLHPHLNWCLQETNIIQGQPLHTQLTCSSDLYRCLKRRLGCSRRRSHSQRDLVTARKQFAHKLPRTKDGLFAHKRVLTPLFKQDSTHTTFVAYITKKEGMRWGPLCALLRILTWCTRKQLNLKARHIPGQLKVVADKLS